MGPRALNRAELRQRLADEAPGWVVDELADLFEPAFLSFRRKADEAAKKRARRPKAEGGEHERRSRQGRPVPEEDAE